VKRYLALSLSLLLAPCVAAAADSKTHQTVDPDDAYKNNCMRCHSALPQYSSRMSQTIMMHMRVAANLPADEADAILAYLAHPPVTPAKEAQKPTTPRHK
jgi:hypothetical protein